MVVPIVAPMNVPVSLKLFHWINSDALRALKWLAKSDILSASIWIFFLDSSLIDPSTEDFIKPQMDGGQPGFFALEYSDEFNGEFLNTNKWVAIEKE